MMLNFSLKHRKITADSTQHMPPVFLYGERIILRPPTRVDFKSWQKVRSKNRKYLTSFEPAWHKHTLTNLYLERRLIRQAKFWHEGLGRYFLICDKEDKLIGGININNICRGIAQFGSLGYWIDQDMQGYGYMKEAIEVIKEYSFNDLNLHHLNAATLTHNTRSIKTLKSCGFKREGYAEKYLKINGKWQDHILFGLNAV